MIFPEKSSGIPKSHGYHKKRKTQNDMIYPNVDTIMIYHKIESISQICAEAISGIQASMFIIFIINELQNIFY